MAASSTERDAELLAVGKQCSHPACLLVDFLPFKCQHCEESFCQEHFLYNAHNCPKYDESQHNRVAPSCPLCNTPVAIPIGQDPNIRMEQHFATECSVMTGRAAKKTLPVCARGRCGKALYAPITCAGCRRQFCPSHRFPQSHDCSKAVSTPASSSAPKLKVASSQASKASSSAPLSGIRQGAATASSHLLNLNAKASGAGAAFKKSLASANKDAGASKDATSSSSKVPNPFSKTDSPSSLNSNPTSTTTDQQSTNNETIHHDIKPAPVIRSSFVPPPIFATA